MTTDLEELRYPVGRFQRRGAMTPEERTAAIDEIAAGLPRKLRGRRREPLGRAARLRRTDPMVGRSGKSCTICRTATSTATCASSWP